MKKVTLTLLCAAICLTAIYGHFIEPFRIEINHLRVGSPRLNTLLAGKTAVHIERGRS
jgi:hypothetical protein